MKRPRSRVGVRLLVLSLVATTSSPALAAEELKFDAVISWRHEEWHEQKANGPSGLVAVPSVLYYWDEELVGRDREGLAAVYDRLKAFKGKSIILRSKPRRRSNYLSGPFSGETLRHFHDLFRNRNLLFAISYTHEEGEIPVFPASENPFRESADGEAKGNKTEQD